jgi:hypothetical protein
MKKLVFLFLIVNNFIFSQDSIKPFFNGFGLLKVNQTTISVIKELETILDTKTRVINSTEEEYQFGKLLDKIENSYSTTNEKNGIICIMIEDSINKWKSPTNASSCNKVKTFKIGGYSVAGINIKNLTIKFYNDTLTEINCENTKELMEAIHLKYGEGEKKIENKEIECTLSLTGNIIKYEETTLTEEWENNDIRAYEMNKKYYDSKCNPKYFHYLNIYSINKNDLIYECEESVETRRENKKNDEKRKSLDDF